MDGKIRQEAIARKKNGKLGSQTAVIKLMKKSRDKHEACSEGKVSPYYLLNKKTNKKAVCALLKTLFLCMFSSTAIQIHLNTCNYSRENTEQFMVLLQ